MQLFRSIRNSINSLFLLMFSIVCLLNINYAVLRSARNALAVADLGGGAGSIPWFELCGTMPGAVLMTLILTWLLNRYPIQRVFYIVLSTFVLFFLVFAIAVYPLLPECKEMISHWTWLPFHTSIATFLPILASFLYFVMAELWKIALLTILFWGLINQYIPLENAKRFYGPLILGGSIGTILAGPIISFCTSEFLSQGSWSQSLIILMGMLAILSALTVWLFTHLWKQLSASKPLPAKNENTTNEDTKEKPISVWESILVCCRSPYLLLLAWVTIADYIAYALGELIFLDVLKQKFPDPRDYCDFMGKLSFWNGILTAFCALVITPYLLRRCRWVVASLITPLCILLTEGAFFFGLWHPSLSSDLGLLVLLGSIFFCLARAVKYTLFDSSKEISFILLPPLEKMQGKLIVDGMCARLGRGSGSLLSLMLIQISGSVLGSAPIAGSIALVIALTCVLATSRLGLLVEKRTPTKSI